MVKMKNISMIVPKPNKIRVILTRFITKQNTTYNYHAVAHLPIVFFFPFFSPIFSFFFSTSFSPTQAKRELRTNDIQDRKKTQSKNFGVCATANFSFFLGLTGISWGFHQISAQRLFCSMEENRTSISVNTLSTE